MKLRGALERKGDNFPRSTAILVGGILAFIVGYSLCMMTCQPSTYNWNEEGPSMPWFETVDIEKSVMFSSHKKEWEKMGKEEVWYSVLTGYDRVQAISEKDKESFYRSGVVDMEWAAGILKRNGLDFTGKSAMDFGCGVGRLAFVLAKSFDEVVCLDQSQPHLDVAAAEAENQGIKNVLFEMSSSSLQQKPRFSFINSMIVLQHAMPSLQVQYVRDFCSLLLPNGSALFQVPTYIPEYIWKPDSAESYIKRGGMQMHATPQREVFRAAHEQGCQVLLVIQRDVIGIPGSESTFFLIYKPFGAHE